MSRGQPTITEVAEAAGVAISTVSRVLNGGSASSKSQAKVEAAVRDLGFSPSAAARNLKRGTTGIVGIAGATTMAPWFVELLGGMEEVLSTHAASLAICALERSGKYDPSPVEAWIERGAIDQLLLVRPGQREAKLCTRAWNAGIPVVSLVPDRKVHRGLSVMADNVDGGLQAASHLLQLGHQDICFLGGPLDSVDAHDRLEGLRRGLGEEGVRLPKSRICFGRNYEIEAGMELGATWLRRRQLRECSAVVLGNDALALGFMRAVQAAGVSIPSDVSVMGFDGVQAGALVWPGLTTVAQPVARMGSELASLLIAPDAVERLHERDVTTYRLSLIQRESTAAPVQPERSGRRGC